MPREKGFLYDLWSMEITHLKAKKNDVEIYYYNWASKASPTLGCSIKISRDIYIVFVVGQKA